MTVDMDERLNTTEITQNNFEIHVFMGSTPFEHADRE